MGSRQRWAGGSAAALAGLLCAGAAQAQAGGGAAGGNGAGPANITPGDPRMAFQRGVAALDEGQFDVAARELELSYRLRPVPVVLFNLGIAHRGQGHYREALSDLERYLADPGAHPSERSVNEARAEVVRLRGQLAQVTLRVEPASGTVAVDGQEEHPVDGVVTLDPGHHVLEVSAERYVIERRTLDLQPGARESLSVSLRPVGGDARLHVATNVPAAAVWVDGARVGVGSVDVPLREGEHRVEVRAANYAPEARTVRAGLTGVVQLDLTLRSTATPAWVLPVAIAGGALVVAGGVWLTAYELRGTTPPVQGSWGRVDVP